LIRAREGGGGLFPSQFLNCDLCLVKVPLVYIQYHYLMAIMVASV